MRLGFSSILALHWTVVFAMLAYGTVADAGGGIGALLEMMGVQPIDATQQGAIVLLSVLLAGNFFFAALMFAWSTIAGLVPQLGAVDDQIDLSRVAYSAGAASMTIVLVAGQFGPADYLYPAVAVQLAALAASYLASYAERLGTVLSSEPEGDDVRAAARLMAVGAAHGAMLTRLSGRGVTTHEGAS